jgi:hypothetical protein
MADVVRKKVKRMCAVKVSAIKKMTAWHLRDAGSGPQDVGALPAVLETEVARICEELGDERLGMTAPWTRQGNAVGGLRWWTGCHTSTAGGMERAVINAAAIGESCITCKCDNQKAAPPQTVQYSGCKYCPDGQFSRESLIQF